MSSLTLPQGWHRASASPTWALWLAGAVQAEVERSPTGWVGTTREGVRLAGAELEPLMRRVEACIRRATEVRATQPIADRGPE